MFPISLSYEAEKHCFRCGLLVIEIRWPHQPSDQSELWTQEVLKVVVLMPHQLREQSFYSFVINIEF